MPYGSTLDADGRALAPNARDLAAIEDIRHMRSIGWPLRRIARELTLRGVPTKNGRPAWSHNSVASILAREPTTDDADRPT